MATEASDIPNPKRNGVPLAAYAAVRAGLNEGLRLDLLLQAEGIPAPRWSRAEDAFDEALADSAAGDGALLRAFDFHLTSAQDRLARPLPPLDRDLGAWLDFVRRWSESERPAALLTELGLRAADLIRLHRGWMGKLSADRELAERAVAILAGEPGELPVPAPPPAAVVLPPRKPEERLTAAEEGEDAEEERDDLDEDALEDEDRSEEPPAVFGPLPDEGSLPPAELASVEIASTEARSPAPSVAVPSFLLARETTSAPPASAAPESPRAAPAPAGGAGPAKPPAVPLNETGEISPDLIARILKSAPPFSGSTPPVSQAAISQKDDSITQDPQPSPLAAALPFAAREAIKVKPAPAGASTADIPRDIIDKINRGAAIPFPQKAPPAQSKPPVAPAPPPSPKVAPPVSAAELTLDQYASMCAELAVFSDRQEAVFAKYGLADGRRRAAVDAAWKQRLARFPSEKAEWERRYWLHEAAWRRSRR
ncbi:MAG: hypothetical protein U0441_22635 [Polyangiaceae bacterium]